MNSKRNGKDSLQICFHRYRFLAEISIDLKGLDIFLKNFLKFWIDHLPQATNHELILN